LVVVHVVMLVVLLVAMMSLPLVMVLVIFGFGKKTPRGSDAWLMRPPVNPQGLLREAPRK
jgi:hypothetical protein